MWKLSIVALILGAVNEQANGQDGSVKSITSVEHFANDNEPKEGVTLVTFDEDENGTVLQSERGAAADDLFTYAGVRLLNENPIGWTMVSNFRFKNSISQARSIGNLLHKDGKTDAYKGVLRVDFCEPGNAEQAVTVNDAGLFLEIVRTRHTKIEAYNASGHCIGVTQAATNRSSFVGFESNEPIAYLRVMANAAPEAQLEELNADFAIDDLFFSDTALDNSRNFSDKICVISSSGERFEYEAMRHDDGFQFASDTDAGNWSSLEREQISWILGPNPLNRTAENPSAQPWTYVMLEDGSVVACERNRHGIFIRKSNGGLISLSGQTIVGFWGGRRTCRYPQPSDFDLGHVVVVMDTVRIATGGASPLFVSGNVEYQLKDAVVFTQEGLDDPNETLSAAEVLEFDPSSPDFDITNAPSTWFRSPVMRDKETTGLVRTYDGREFVLNGSAGFKLADVEFDSVIISLHDDKFRIPFSDIAALQFPSDE